MNKQDIPQSAEQASEPVVERHPLEPFLPENARLLMLGSFPPPRRRWSMEFYYPNLQNDMWRIFGYHFFGERDHFLTPRPQGLRPRTARGVPPYEGGRPVRYGLRGDSPEWQRIGQFSSSCA